MKKYKLWKAAFTIAALLLFAATALFQSCSDDDDDDSGPSLKGLKFDTFQTGRYSLDMSEVDGAYKVPLGEFTVAIKKVYSNGHEDKVKFADKDNNVRIICYPGTGSAEVGGDGDKIIAKTEGTFTAWVGVCRDKKLMTEEVTSVDQVMNYWKSGKIDPITHIEFIAYKAAGQNVPVYVSSLSLSTPSKSLLKVGEDLELPTNVTLTYTDGHEQQLQTGSTVPYYFSGDKTELVDNGTTIATISGTILKAMAPGTATIYCKYDGKKSNEVTINIKSEAEYNAAQDKLKALKSIEVSLKDGATSVKGAKSIELKTIAKYDGYPDEDVTMLADYLVISGTGKMGTGENKNIFIAPNVDEALTNMVLVTYGKTDTTKGKTNTLVINITAADKIPTPGDSGSGGSDSDDSSKDDTQKPNNNTGTAGIEINFGGVNTQTDQKTDPDLKPDESTKPSTPTIDDEEKVTVTPIPDGKKAIFVKAESAPKLWAWTTDGAKGGIESSGKGEGESWPGESMEDASSYMNNGAGWFVKFFASANIDDNELNLHLNGGGAFSVGKMTGNALYWDGSKATATDPTKAPDPEKPTITISPATGSTIGAKGTISVTISKNLSKISAASVKVGTVTKGLSDVTVNGNTINVKATDAIASKGAILVEVSATNGVGTSTAKATINYDPTAKEDVFTWDNVYCYFVLTDRFQNGDTTNDHSYGRKNGSGIPEVATFHGGDLKGLTSKIDYLDKLGVNAIWITAPYEQMHGWCDGKDSKFPHYAFHGYYTLDWTSMDANMGTLEEYRTFINTCHSKGIRVIMDVVMNHTGYNTVNDMVTYDFGGFTGSKPAYDWCAATGGKWSQGDGAGVDWTSPSWGNWWGCWVRAFDGQFGFAPNGSGDICMSLAGLPDIVTEKQDAVAIPKFLKGKWQKENTASGAMKNYANPMVAIGGWGSVKAGDWRGDKMGAPADYLVAWLSAWVRELGIDGFRCDTAKHVHMNRWGQLKKACQAALEDWRKDTTKSKGVGTDAASWTQSFWMTGECFGWSSTGGQGDYYSTGGFDSMINFSFNGVSGSTGHAPTTSDWNSYINIGKNQDSDGNGNRNSVLSYVSSHDTGLHRSTGSIKLATMLGLLPGGVQVYYGDESDRPECNGYGDADMKIRGDMKWASEAQLKQWGKIGKFRKYNPAVGAGTGTGTDRTYKDNHVLIAAGGSVTVPAGDWWNWYTGAKASGTVSGTVEAPALISNKDPSEYADAMANF